MKEERYLKCCIRIIGNSQINHIIEDYFCSEFDNFEEIYNCDIGTLLAVKSNPQNMPYLMKIINKNNEHGTNIILVADLKSNYKMILCEDEYTLSDMSIYLVNKDKELSGNSKPMKVTAKRYEVKKHIETYNAIYYINYNDLYDLIEIGDYVLVKMTNEYEVLRVGNKYEDMFLDKPRKIINLHSNLGLNLTVTIFDGQLSSNCKEILLISQDDSKEDKNGN